MNATVAPIIGIDAINLIEGGLDKMCDCTVAVLSSAELRLGRIMARDGISEEYARLRIAAQKGDDFYRQHCTYTLNNTCDSAAAFEEQAYVFFYGLLQEAKK